MSSPLFLRSDDAGLSPGTNATIEAAPSPAPRSASWPSAPPLKKPPPESSIAAFHPAQADGVMEYLILYSDQSNPLPIRQAEYALLSSPAFADLLQVKSITLHCFDNPN